MYGMDPDAILEELESTRTERHRIETEYETMKVGFGDLWAQWILKYKQVLS